MATEIFRNWEKAEQAFHADSLNIDLMQVADKAFAIYNTATSKAREEWDAIPDSDAKYSAVTNAEDTEGTATDELFYLEIALATYRMNIDAGYYNVDGSDK